MNHLRPSDIIAAAAPTVSATLVAQANQIVGMIGSLLIMGGVVALSYFGTQLTRKADLANELVNANKKIDELTSSPVSPNTP